MLAGCSLEDWQTIVGRAVTDAKGGDAKAREWLARYLIGTPEGVAPRLLEMAAEAAAGIDPVEDAANVKRMFCAYDPTGRDYPRPLVSLSRRPDLVRPFPECRRTKVRFARLPASSNRGSNDQPAADAAVFAGIAV